MILARLARVASGVAPDMPYGKRLWVADQNMRYTDEGMRPLPGQYYLINVDAGAPVLGMGELLDDNVEPHAPAIYYGNITSLYEILNGALTDVSRITGTYTGDPDMVRWSFSQWGKWRLATNGVDNPQLWQKANPLTVDKEQFEDISVDSDLLSTFTAEIVRTNGAFTLFFNTDNDSAEYIWCSADDVLQYIPVEANSAGSHIIRELGSGIIAAEPFRKGIAVFGKNKMFYVRDTGYPYYYGHEFLLEGIGAVSKDSVVDVGGRLFGFGQHAIWTTDGTGYQFIDDAVHREIYDNFNRDQMNKVVALHNPTVTSVYFFWPERESLEISRGFSFDYKSQAWGELDFLRTAGVPGSAFAFPITGGLDGRIYVQSTPESGELPSFDNPVAVEDQVVITIPELYGDGFYGNGFYGGWRQEGPEVPDDVMLVAVAEISVVLIYNGVEFPIGAVSDTTTAFVESDWLELSQEGAPASSVMKFIDYIRVVLLNKELATNFQITISYKDSLDRPGIEMEPILFSDLLGPDDDPDKLLDGGIYENLPDEAVYFKFRFEDTRIVDPSWHLTEFDIHGEYVGEYV